LESAEYAVPVNHRISADINIVQTADVHHSQCFAFALIIETKGCAATGGAKMVLDNMLVEGVGRQIRLPCGDSEILPREKPEEIAFLSTVGATAVDQLINVAFHVKANLSTVATPVVRHRALDSFR
jgi:hypothetical protein